MNEKGRESFIPTFPRLNWGKVKPNGAENNFFLPGNNKRFISDISFSNWKGHFLSAKKA
jgi:hypothetical protein